MLHSQWLVMYQILMSRAARTSLMLLPALQEQEDKRNSIKQQITDEFDEISELTELTVNLSGTRRARAEIRFKASLQTVQGFSNKMNRINNRIKIINTGITAISYKDEDDD